MNIQVDPDSAIPLAVQVTEQLTWLIVGGALSAGDELPPMRDLADELGINLHTVHAGYRQLEERGLVSLGRGRRARVQTIDRTRGRWTPALVPSHTIGVILPEFAQVYAPFLSAVEAAAASLPALVFAANAHESPATAAAYLTKLASRGVDGIIVGLALDRADALAATALGDPPIVFVDAPGSPGTRIDYDLERSQYLATRHLIEHGHRRIGLVTGPLRLPNIAPKVSGHQRALQEAGLPEDQSLLAEAADFKAQSGALAASRLLDAADRPTAITATADPLAAGVYQAARSRGIQIPDDLAITSNDDSEIATLLDPPLTTVSLPIREAGALAVESLTRIRRGEPVAESVVLDVELIVRSSCGCPNGR